MRMTIPRHIPADRCSFTGKEVYERRVPGNIEVYIASGEMHGPVGWCKQAFWATLRCNDVSIVDVYVIGETEGPMADRHGDYLELRKLIDRGHVEPSWLIDLYFRNMDSGTSPGRRVLGWMEQVAFQAHTKGIRTNQLDVQAALGIKVDPAVPGA